MTKNYTLLIVVAVLVVGFLYWKKTQTAPAAPAATA